MERLETEKDLRVAVNSLVAIEPRFARVLERHGLPRLRHAEPGLESLLRIVTDQLISLRAGEAIWSRLATRFGRFTPEDVLSASEQELRGLGLSGAKARSFRAAALAFSEGHFAETPALSAEEVQRRLLGITGIGPWTTSLYLLTALRAADAWPAADLALQVAARDVFAMDQKPSHRQMAALAEAWRPHRSAAALLLWQHYRHLRGLPPG